MTKENLRSHWCDQPFEKIKKVSATLKVSLWFNNRHTLGPYRGLNQLEIVKGGPPLWLAMVQIFLYVCVRLKMLQSDRERGARSVANLATFQTNPTNFFPKIATSDKSRLLGQSLACLSDRWYCRGGARSVRTQVFLCICSVQWASERSSPARSVKRDIIASLILHANIAKITAQELALSCLILCIIWFHQTTAQ